MKCSQCEGANMERYRVVAMMTIDEIKDAIAVLHEDSSCMDDDDEGEHYKAGIQKLISALYRATDR